MAIQLDTNKALTNDEQIQFIIQLKFDLSFIELNDSIDNEILYETALFKTSIVDKGTLTYLHIREYLEYLSNNDNLKFQDKLMSINVN